MPPKAKAKPDPYPLATARLTVCNGVQCTKKGGAELLEDIEDLCKGFTSVTTQDCLLECQKGPNIQCMYKGKKASKGLQIHTGLSTFKKVAQLVRTEAGLPMTDDALLIAEYKFNDRRDEKQRPEVAEGYEKAVEAEETRKRLEAEELERKKLAAAKKRREKAAADAKAKKDAEEAAEAKVKEEEETRWMEAADAESRAANEAAAKAEEEARAKAKSEEEAAAAAAAAEAAAAAAAEAEAEAVRVREAEDAKHEEIRLREEEAEKAKLKLQTKPTLFEMLSCRCTHAAEPEVDGEALHGSVQG
eukprot:TRINITY_DN45772_c0_g1_i1.p1 TRINITY_DN45772_c0_g1~~TRINITY_DN45772_c0_g1_i1.p1  ORF type:complete len:303 (+),score=100.15 TRINITY_DN45772_c0_g1_i1:59-967(+)